MKQKIGIAGIYLLGALAAQAGNYTVKSPDGKLAVNVLCEGGKASYTVDYEGKQMLSPSALPEAHDGCPEGWGSEASLIQDESHQEIAYSEGCGRGNHRIPQREEGFHDPSSPRFGQRYRLQV